LKHGCQEVVSPKHRVFRSKYIWDSNSGDPTLLDLLVSYTYIALWLVWKLLWVRYEGVVAGAFVFANGFIFAICRLLRVPCIGLGNAEEFTLELYGKGIKNKVKQPWLRYTHRLADGFVVVCRFCKDVLVDLGLDSERIEIVPSSVNPRKRIPARDKESHGYQILSVGRLVERKGFHCLIEAVGMLKEELPAIQAVIVGNGPYGDVLREKTTSLGLEDRVFIKESVEDEELSRLYRESDLFVLAHMMLENGDTEGCPTVFSEASGCGLPVIGGTQGGADTVIVDGVTGYIVDARDISTLAARIREILRDPELADTMARAGMEKIKRDHTPAVTSGAFYAALRRLCGSQDSAVGPYQSERVLR
jgi:phosphatidylinositol alpha-1,6-mannosyltransferase